MIFGYFFYSDVRQQQSSDCIQTGSSTRMLRFQSYQLKFQYYTNFIQSTRRIQLAAYCLLDLPAPAGQQQITQCLRPSH